MIYTPQMPTKEICPQCFSKYRARDLPRHIARHDDPTFTPTRSDPATAEELQAAGLDSSPPAEAAVDSPQEAAMSTSPAAGAEPVTQDQLTIRDLQRENADLKTQLGGHQPLKTNLAHVAGCSNCRLELEEYNKGIITAAIDGLSVEAIRNLGFEKGAFPQKFVIPGGG